MGDCPSLRCLTRRGVKRRAAERELVAVRVAVDRLAHAVGQCLAIGGLKPARSDRGYSGIEIIKEDRDHGFACAIGVLTT